MRKAFSKLDTRALVLLVCLNASLLFPFGLISQNHADNSERQMFWNKQPFGAYQASSELSERRSANEKHFQRPDGQVEMFFSSEPINYLENGSWETIYNTIIEDHNGVYRFSNLNNTFKSYYAGNVQDGFKTIMNGVELLEMRNASLYYEVNGEKVGIQNIQNSQGTVNGNELLYKKVYGNAIDLLVTQSGGKRKLDYVIKDRSAINEAYSNGQYLVFSEEIVLPKGWSAKLENGVILLIDDTGVVASAYEKPTIFDSNENLREKDAQTTAYIDPTVGYMKAEINEKLQSEINQGSQLDEYISYDMQLVDNKLIILTKVSLFYLFDEKREYPVIIDPTLTGVWNSGGWAYSYNNSCNFGPQLLTFTTSGAPNSSAITNTSINFNQTQPMYYRSGCQWWTSWSSTTNNLCNNWWGYGLFDWETGSSTFGQGFIGCDFTVPDFNCKNPNRTWAVSLWSLDGWVYGTQYNWNITITYETVSAPTSITGTTSICSGSSTTLTAAGGSADAGSTAITNQWFTGSCGGTLVGTGNSITVTPTTSTTYYVRRVGQCSTTSCASVLVNVTAVPSQPANSLTGPTEVCVPATESYTINAAANAVSYRWQYRTDNTLGWSTVNASGSTSQDVSWPDIQSSTAQIRVRAQNGSCNSNWRTFSNIQLNQAPTSPISIIGSSTVCAGENVALTANGGSDGSGATFQWGTGTVGSDIISGQTASTLTVSPTTTTTYWVRRIGNTACSNTTSGVTITVTVNNPTLATAPTNGDMVWRGASSNDWATIGNWWQYNGTSYAAASAAPTTAQNVIIPANQTCVLNQPNTNANIGNANSLRIESGATLTMGSGNLNVAGNWVNNGSFVPGTGTVTFAGSGTHTVSGTAANHNFNNLTMNKTGEVQLSVPITMSGTLTLTNGRLNIGNLNLDLPTNTINGGNANSYVLTSGTGVLMRNVGASTVNFPVGRGAYNPAALTNSGVADKFSVRVIDNVTDNGDNADTDPTTTMAVVNRTWMVDEQTAGGSNVTLRLNWNGAGEQINGFQGANAFIAHYFTSEGLWDNIGGTVPSLNVIETSGITSFSPFTISSDNAFAPLPVELIAFSAHCQNDDVEVKWSTASEHNSQHFTLQVSEDGMNWSNLYVAQGAGFSNTVVEYSYVHANAARAKNYYRLIQYDYDGAYETYNTIMSNCSSDDAVFMTFPNPSVDAFTVVVNDELLSGANVLTISDASGKVLYSIAVELEYGSGSFALEDLDLPAGLYYLQLNNGSHTSRVIKHSFR